MNKHLIIYSSVDGHTKMICEHILKLINKENAVDIVSLNQAQNKNLSEYDVITIGASIRYGKHCQELFQFIQKNHTALNAKQNAFFTVNAVARKNNKNTPTTNPYMKKFLKLSKWQPGILGVFGGKIDYPKYNFFDKRIIQFIMLITQGPTDTSKSYEFTNWKDVECFSDKISI